MNKLESIKIHFTHVPMRLKGLAIEHSLNHAVIYTEFSRMDSSHLSVCTLFLVPKSNLPA